MMDAGKLEYTSPLISFQQNIYISNLQDLFQCSDTNENEKYCRLEFTITETSAVYINLYLQKVTNIQMRY
jgi:hypothetical protein